MTILDNQALKIQKNLHIPIEKSGLDRYEKILTFDLNQTERRMVQNKLLSLYEKLGKVKEFFNLKKSM